jgi:hypothetical protein
VAAEAVALPAKVVRVIEASSNINPVTGVWLGDIGVGGHAGKTEDCLLVGDVWAGNVIYSPSRSRQRDGFTTHLTSLQQAVDGVASSVS